MSERNVLIKRQTYFAGVDLEYHSLRMRRLDLACDEDLANALQQQFVFAVNVI